MTIRHLFSRKNSFERKEKYTSDGGSFIAEKSSTVSLEVMVVGVMIHGKNNVLSMVFA